MGNLNKFNANEYPENEKQKGAYSLVPKGKHLACIVESETKPTRKGDGEMLSLRFEILQGDAKGRLLFENLLLEHPSEKAVQIAKEKLAAICRATGILTPNDSSELHNKPFLVDVGIRVNKQSGEDENVIRGFEKGTKTPAPSAMKRAPLHSSLPKVEEELMESSGIYSEDDDEIPF